MLDDILRLLAHWIPTRLRYFILIDSAANYSTAHPTTHVPDITWDEMARDLE